MERRTKLEADRAKMASMRQDEKDGLVADSAEVRLGLLKKFRAGELTGLEMQAELKKVKRDAKKNGKITRSQAFHRG